MAEASRRSSHHFQTNARRERFLEERSRSRRGSVDSIRRLGAARVGRSSRWPWTRGAPRLRDVRSACVWRLDDLVVPERRVHARGIQCALTRTVAASKPSPHCSAREPSRRSTAPDRTPSSPPPHAGAAIPSAVTADASPRLSRVTYLHCCPSLSHSYGAPYQRPSMSTKIQGFPPVPSTMATSTYNVRRASLCWRARSTVAHLHDLRETRD